MDAGDAWRNLCKLKTLCENGWVPQKCGAYELIEKGATSATMWQQVWDYVWHYQTEVGVFLFLFHQNKSNILTSRAFQKHIASLGFLNFEI